MTKMSLSFKVDQDGWFFVHQHIQVTEDQYTWALVGAGPSKADALLSAQLFFDGCKECLEKYKKDMS